MKGKMQYFGLSENQSVNEYSEEFQKNSYNKLLTSIGIPRKQYFDNIN